MNAFSKAANRLHHLSMRYAGAFVELLKGEPTWGLPHGHPGLKETRDFIDLILFTRAEINAIGKILEETGVITTVNLPAGTHISIRPISMARVAEIIQSEYEWLTKVKAQFLNVGVSDEGIVIQGSQRN